MILKKECEICKKLFRNIYKMKDGKKVCWRCSSREYGHRPTGPLSHLARETKWTKEELQS